jgi:hypothetical protein
MHALPRLHVFTMALVIWTVLCASNSGSPWQGGSLLTVWHSACHKRDLDAHLLQLALHISNYL